MRKMVVTERPAGICFDVNMIRVTKNASRPMYGSCNACTTARTDELVTSIDLRGMSFRVCDPCRKTLKKML